MRREAVRKLRRQSTAAALNDHLASNRRFIQSSTFNESALNCPVNRPEATERNERRHRECVSIMTMKSIAFLCPYFGRWPDWIDYTLLSAAANPTIDWHFFTDCSQPAIEAPNLHFHFSTFQQYKENVSEVLGIDFRQAVPYKLCDLKPFLGKLHAELISNCDFYGIADLDLIWGDLRRWFSAHRLQYDLISCLSDRICGHCCLFRNTETHRRAYERIPHWQSLLADAKSHTLDESKLSKIYLRHRRYPHWLRKLTGFLDPMQRSAYFEDGYATILTPGPWWNGRMDHPEYWIWRPGSLTNTSDGPREFPYFHFMNWKSARYLPKSRAAQPAWEGLDIRGISPDDARSGFCITAKGFFPLSYSEK